MGYLIGGNVGGTFTDFLLVDEVGNMRIAMVSSIFTRSADAVMKG